MRRAAPGHALAGQGPPGVNIGVDFDTYYDIASGLMYGPKSGGLWPRAGVADATAPWTIYDFRYGAAHPSSILTLTRAGATSFATNLCYHDASGASYSTFAANTPIRRADLGLGIFASSKNFFINCLAPVTQTVTLPATGKYIAWLNGTGSITTAAGTATGSGFGTLDGAAQSYQIITITGTGTVTVTVSGSVNAVQFEALPGLEANSAPTPLIITGASAVTRNADVYDIAGALMTLLSSGTGTLVIQTGRIEIGTGFGRNPDLLSLNGTAELYASSATQYAYIDAGHSTNGTIGYLDVWSGRVRSAMAWSGVTMTFGAGNRIVAPFAQQINNGTAVTAARLGCLLNATYGVHTLGGWVERLEYRTDRVTDLALRAAYNDLPHVGRYLNV